MPAFMERQRFRLEPGPIPLDLRYCSPLNTHYPCYHFLALELLVLVSSAAAAMLTIDYPSENEIVMAECRNFYVTSAIPAGIAIPGDVRIEVFSGASAAGTSVRVIESHVDPAIGTTPLSAIAADYPNGTAKGTVIAPDLIRDPGGLRETWNKVVVTRVYYSGLVLGGASKQFDMNYTDREGRPLEDLVAGEYTVRVTGVSASSSRGSPARSTTRLSTAWTS